MAGISANVTNYIAKGVGLGTLALVGYDSHHAGTMEANNFSKTIKTDSLQKQFNESQKLDSPSIVRSEIKKRIFNLHAEENITGIFTTPLGYLKGFSNMLIGNAIPLGLSIGTIMAPKGFLTKTFGFGLLAYGGLFLLQQGLGVGKHQE